MTEKTPQRPGAPPSGLSDPAFVQEQYRDASNLQARMHLHERFSTNPYGWFRWLFDHLREVGADGRLLEVGCGTARLWQENADRIPAGWDITLTDQSPMMLRQCLSVLKRTGRRWQGAVVDVQKIPYDDGSFDAVIANFMLYHVPDRERAYSEIRRVLRPTGRFFASTVGRAHMHEIDDLLHEVRESAKVDDAGEPGFSLENGADQLRRWFDRVELYRYDDGLRVTEKEPLIEYVLSTAEGQRFSLDELERLDAIVTDRLAQQGTIHVTKDPGLFVASNPYR